jgi:hypothetical protein
MAMNLARSREEVEKEARGESVAEADHAEI